MYRSGILKYRYCSHGWIFQLGEHLCWGPRLQIVLSEQDRLSVRLIMATKSSCVKFFKIYSVLVKHYYRPWVQEFCQSLQSTGNKIEPACSHVDMTISTFFFVKSRVAALNDLPSLSCSVFLGGHCPLVCFSTLLHYQWLFLCSWKCHQREGVKRK